MGAKFCMSINFGGLRENFDSTVVCLVAGLGMKMRLEVTLF